MPHKHTPFRSTDTCKGSGIRRIALVGISLIALIAISCEKRAVWGFPPDEFAEAVAERPESVLAAITVSTVTEAEHIDTEWPMVLALLAEAYERPEIVDPLLEAGFDASSGEVRLMYGTELSERRLAERRYLEAEEIARATIGRFPQETRILFNYARSLYRQEKNERVLDALEDLETRGTIDSLDAADQREVAIMRAVTHARMGLEGWDRDILNLFLDVTMSQIHIRAFAFIEELPGGTEYFSLVEYDLMRALSLAAQGQYESAYKAMPREIAETPAYWTGTVIEFIRLVTTQTSRYIDGYTLLKNIADRAPTPEIRAVARFHSGLVARTAEWLWPAVDGFERALGAELSPSLAERIRWYLIDTSSMISLPQGIWIISKYGPSIEKPSYYDDTFETMLRDITASRSWILFQNLYPHISAYGSEYIRSLASHLYAALYDYGYIATKNDVGVVVGDYLDVASKSTGLQTGSTYYRIVAGGSPIPATDPAGLEDSISGSSKDGSSRFPEAAMSVLERLIAVRAFDLAYDWIYHHDLPYSNPHVWNVIEGLSNEGLTTPAMRLIDRYAAALSTDAGIDASAVLRISYPLAFREAISAAAAEAGIPEALLYAVVREESYFQAEVESVAGAIGLSQLMPDTAADMAGRIGLRAYNLTKPQDNLTIGAHYLSYCIDLFGTEFLGLLAYNAGLGRVREWLGLYGDLPSSLFLEAIPFYETRQYIRKITRALAFYTELYPDIETSAELPLLLPHFTVGETESGD